MPPCKRKKEKPLASYATATLTFVLFCLTKAKTSNQDFNVIHLHLRKFQCEHLSGKPGTVREFDSFQGNVRDFTENQGIVREKILSGKSCLKLFIVNCIFVSIQVFSRSLLCLKC